MGEAMREATFQEAIEAGNLEHATSLYKRLKQCHIETVNGYEARMKELRWEISRLQFLVNKLLDAEMEDAEMLRFVKDRKLGIEWHMEALED